MEENLPVSLNRYSVVVIPAYEPSPGLIPLVRSLVDADYRVIVVDDGSGDGFSHIWEEIDGHAVLIHHMHNEGKGAALKTSFKYINDWMPDAGCIITMDADGNAKSDFLTWNYIRESHPRTAIGYYEPGHYCLLVVDGRQPGLSRGMFLEEMSQLFASLGCRAAYNLDGGHCAFMTRDANVISKPYRPSKDISDGIFICEPEA